MTQITRTALRTAQPLGRQTSSVSPTPDINDQQAPVSDSQPLPASLPRPPTSDGSVLTDNDTLRRLPVYNDAIALVTPTNTAIISNPQLMNREA